ncbi:sensor histidine kinase [Paenibacillus thalictri]|nr:sensor histidine kinase [Paenibacillus thalictri]
MARLIGLLIPATLRTRLFMAFILLIFFPFSILNLYNFQEVKNVMQQKASEQSHEQLEKMIQDLKNFMSLSFKTTIMLEQDSTVLSILKSPQNYSPLERKHQIEDKFKTINNSFFFNGPQVYYTLIDYYGNAYTSYQPMESIHAEALTREDWFVSLKSGQPYRWISNDPNYVHPDASKSPELLSLTARLSDMYQVPYGVARVSLDYSFWFKNITRDPSINQDFYIITQNGEVIAESRSDAGLPIESLKADLHSAADGYVIDKGSNSILNYSYIDSAGWYMVSKMSLDFLFQEMEAMKRRFFITMLLSTTLFIGATYVVSLAMTRPLQMLQKRMAQAVRLDMKAAFPTSQLKGEVLDLTLTFNKMIHDANELIQRLKMEERQKEAVRFQMLLTQMNPHFLLNTLNTVKWIAIRKEIPEIREICISLGTLLETSLNSKMEMIHLQDELQLVKAYEYIQSFKYKNQFHVEYLLSDQVKYALVPKLCLQPLVENSILHGFDGMEEQGFIRIRVYAEDKYLVMEIEDNGVGLNPEHQSTPLRKREGIGMKNINERLKLLFKSEASLEVLSLNQGTLVRMRFPLLISEPFREGERRHVEGFIG